jgi:hypothetical protein
MEARAGTEKQKGRAWWRRSFGLTVLRARILPMIQDLLAITDHEPPMGDLFTGRRLDTARALWAEASPVAGGTPKKRILHERVVRLHGPARLERLGLRRGPGYHKCGSRQDLDWVVAGRVLGWVDGQWQVLWEADDLIPPAPREVQWVSLGGVNVSGVIIQVLRSGIDEEWSPWNLAMSAFVLEGELLEPLAPRRERLLEIGRVDLSKLPAGVRAWAADGEVRYVTPSFEIGFHLSRPGCSFLALRLEDPARESVNVLQTRPPLFHQGPHLHEVGAAPVLAPSVRCDLKGRVEVRGATVSYGLKAGGQQYRLTWRIAADAATLRVERTAAESRTAWHSCAWVLGLRNSATPSHVLGALHQDGETGAVALPGLLVLPTFGSWRIEGGASGWLRSECVRERDLNLLEFKVGEERTPEGLYRLPAGRHVATFSLRPQRPPELLRPEAPVVVRRALARTQWVALTFRPDTATLSNNGASIHCPICMDTWSAVALPQKKILPGLDGADLLRLSLERWLNGGPGYAAGRLLQEGKSHDADDEYLMTGASALRGLGDFLHVAATPEWYHAYREPILRRIEAARERDLDGDGLIESVYRTGVSGTSQWSTCWFDVVSFGWKDALANAILHGALQALEEGLRRFEERAVPAQLQEWRERLRANYRAAFWNPATGWLAGWRCREDQLHDHAFLPVNGAAIVEGLLSLDEGRQVLERLLAEARRVGLPDARYGLPGNLRPIPDHDLSDILQGYPMGYYQNGGRTHAQSRHFVNALYRVGLTEEADQLLGRLCVGLAEAAVFGGNQTGVDWRYWDDRPCGYEGLLTDQFGILETILARWGRKPVTAAKRPRSKVRTPKQPERPLLAQA